MGFSTDAWTNTMKRMKNISKVLLFALLPLLAAGCVTDRSTMPDNRLDASEKVSVTIEPLAAIGSTIDGVTVGSVRIIAVGDTGAVEFNKNRNAFSGDLGYDDQEYGPNEAGDYIVDIFPGRYDFYVVVNESAAHTAALNAIRSRADLLAVKLVATEIEAVTEASMVCVGSVAAVDVRRDGGGEGPGPAEVSVGGGAWSDELTVYVERVATKLSVKVRKNTADPGDSFVIKGARLANVPQYSYMVAQNYDGGFGEKTAYTGNAAFDANTGTYAVLFENYIVPEHLMTNPGDNTGATTLTLVADYTVAGDNAADEVGYTMPLLGNASNFNMVRNRHYIVEITIAARGEFEYTPFIEYEVAKWDKAAADEGDVTIDDIYEISWDWAAGTNVEGANTVGVGNNGYVRMDFTLAAPEMALWTAHLTNPLDFYIDEVSGAGSGSARAGIPYSIVIRPRAESSTALFTEFYITLDNGTREIEYDLIEGRSGPGNRWIIRQIPN